MKVSKKDIMRLFTSFALLSLLVSMGAAATTTPTKTDILNFLKSDKTEKLQRTDSFTDKDFAYLLQDNAAAEGISCRVLCVTYSDGSNQYFNDFSTNEGSLIISCRGTFEKTGVDKKTDTPTVGQVLNIFYLWRDDSFNYGHRFNGELTTVEKITYLDRTGTASKTSTCSTCSKFSTCSKTTTSCTECQECKAACGNNTTCLATCNSVCSTCPTASTKTKSDSCTSCSKCIESCNGDADCIAKCKESSDCKSCTSSSSTSKANTKTIGSCSASDNAKIEEVIKEYYSLKSSERTPCKLRSIMKGVFGE